MLQRFLIEEQKTCLKYGDIISNISFNPKFTITPKINKALAEIERVRGFLDAIKLKDDWIADTQKKALLPESHHSTHIEGTALSLEESKEILEGRK